MGVEVLAVISASFRVFRYVGLCNLIGTYQCFAEEYCLDVHTRR